MSQKQVATGQIGRYLVAMGLGVPKERPNCYNPFIGHIATEMAQIGYARVSTPQQDEAAQVRALKEAGCTEVFSERISTRVPESQRVQLQAALSRLTS